MSSPFTLPKLGVCVVLLTATASVQASNSSAVPVEPSVAYVVNQGSHEIVQCAINDGVFSSCVAAGIANFLDNPYDIVINTAGNRTYISNGGGSITYCQILPDQSFSNCSFSALINSPKLVGIALNANNTRLYTTDFSNGKVLRCAIDPQDGEPVHCVDSGANLAFQGPKGITLHPHNEKAYVVNNTNNSVSVCTVSQADGAFVSCHDSNHTGVSFSDPELISLNANGSLAYIANSGNNTVSLCPILANGDFGDCTSATNSGAAFAAPKAVGLMADSASAYVINNSDGSGSVAQCPITENGFGVCEDASDSSDTFNNPWGIALR